MPVLTRAFLRACPFTIFVLLIASIASGAEPWRIAGEGVLNTPAGIAVHGDAIYVADFDHHRVEVFSRNGERVGGWGGAGSTPGRFNGPSGIAVDSNGQIYVTDFYNHRVQVFAGDGRYLHEWGARGGADGEFGGPLGIAIDRVGHVYVTDLDNHRVQRFTAAGNFLSAWGGKGAKRGQMIDPWGIAIGPGGDVYVADHGNHRIQRFASDGGAKAWALTAAPDEGGPLGPVAIALGFDGTLYVTDLIADRVLRFNADGTTSGYLELATLGGSGLRYGLALDGDALLATDAGRDRIERTSLGAFESIARTSVPLRFALSRTWPNPSRGATLLRFDLPSRGRMRVEIFGVDGRRVRHFDETEFTAGETVVHWNGSSDGGQPAGPGIYFVRGRFDDGRTPVTATGRIVLLQ